MIPIQLKAHLKHANPGLEFTVKKGKVLLPSNAKIDISFLEEDEIEATTHNGLEFQGQMKSILTPAESDYLLEIVDVP